MEYMLLNEIYINGNKMVGREKRGLPYNQWTYVFENDMILEGKEFGRNTTVTIKCNGTNTYHQRKFKERWFRKPWVCQSHSVSGARNGMFGKSHSDDTKQKFKDRIPSYGFKGKQHTTESKKQISEAVSGENNPFYGKSHTEETKKKLSDAMSGRYVGEDNPFYGKTHTEETKNTIREKGRQWREENPDLSREAGLKGFRGAMWHNIRYGVKTSIERKTEDKLRELGIEDFNFSQVLDRQYQYDFKIGDNILLEVHGDYWHGNPNKYTVLNEVQQKKQKQDEIKSKFAENNGYKLFVIWEEDINNEDWNILHKIKRLLNEDI